ncbi:MAG TPA: two-component regulator propeller domain-containing protein [Flavobacteriales bacterium]
MMCETAQKTFAKRVLRSLLLFVLAVGFHISNAQQYTFIPYSIKQGLVQSQVRCLMQDSRGYIWVGTLGGLSRFDGRVFQNYDRNSGLLSNQINCLLELSNKDILVGSNGSISIINGLGVQSLSFEGNWKEATINTLYQLDDVVLIGTENGLLSYSLAQKRLVSNQEVYAPVADKHIKTIARSKSGDLCLLTKESLWRVRDNKCELFYKPVSSETNFFDLVESNDGTLWLATKGEGLMYLRNGVAGNFLSSFPSMPQTITNLFITQNDELWMTSRFGFLSYDGEQFQFITDQNGLPTGDVRDILCDRDGNIWVGTYGSGLQKFTGNTFINYSKSDGLSSDAVMSILEDEEGNMWFSTFDNGICRMTDDSIVKFNLRELNSNSRIWTSQRTADGSLWFGSSEGLFCIKDQKLTHFTEKDSLQDKLVLSLFEDREQRLWIGTAKGVALYDGETIHPFVSDDAPKKRIRSIRQDHNGNIWMACIEGLYKYDGARFTMYSQRDGLSENSIYCVEIDASNRVWAGTQNGLCYLSGRLFQAVPVDPKISGSNVINFLRYTHHTLWVGTNNGLYSTHLDGFVPGQSLSFRNYSVEDGLKSLETNFNSSFIDSKNRMWFGTTEGAVVFNPQELNSTGGTRSQRPLIHFTNLQINLENQHWSNFDQPIDPISGLLIHPEFSYKQNHLTFFFTGISTTYPHDLEYQFILEGFDDDWKPLTTSSSATYSNLPYKSYVFKVKAINKEGLWSDEITYAFSVRPPFWLTWWFVTLEVMLALSIISYIIYNRRKVLKEKREREWFEVKSKMLALEQQSLNSSMNRHFIFNALNSIQYYINRQDRMAANRYLSDFAKLIRKNLDNTQENLTSLRDEIERLELYLKLEHMRFNDKFVYSINVDPQLDLDRIKVPPMLIQPFLENSIWHGLLPKTETGEVRLDITRVNGHLEFSVTDNGIGIENSLKNKTTADNHISKGMEITQNRLELIQKSTGQSIELRGPWQLSDEHGNSIGTKVQILLPLNFHELFSDRVV